MYKFILFLKCKLGWHDDKLKLVDVIYSVVFKGDVVHQIKENHVPHWKCVNCKRLKAITND